MTPEILPRPEYRKTYEIVGWAYDADLRCNPCAQARFGDSLKDELNPPADQEGNPVTPVFLGDLRGDEVCGDCFRKLGE